MASQPVNFGPTVEQRQNPTVALFQQFLDSILQSLRVAVPAIVQSVNYGPPLTVTVIIATNELVTQNESQDQISLKTQAIQLPPLQDVPVVMPSAGGWGLTLPIDPGDECLVIFADTPLDVWLQNGGLNNHPVTQRRHSLSDAVAVFGLRSKPRALADYSQDSAQLRNDDGSVVIDLGDDGITITAPKVTVNCTDTATVNADKVEVTGTSEVKLGDHTTIDGRAFLTHSHSGVQNGSGFTGPVA